MCGAVAWVWLLLPFFVFACVEGPVPQLLTESRLSRTITRTLFLVSLGLLLCFCFKFERRRRICSAETNCYSLLPIRSLKKIADYDE